mgnify:CR=1 FL=1
MPKLNLEAKNETQKIIKDYLEKNVSDILADKINNGVRIQKDGKTLISKKTLAGCMDFALKEAQKLTEKSARAACIQDSVVFGWAIHFFEEDSIEGTLYNEDGTEYKPPKAATPPKPATAYTPPKPQPKPQMSLFELMENNATEEKPSENTQYVLQKTEQSDNPERDDEEPCDDAETDEAPTEEELREAAETEKDLPLPAMPEKAKAVQMQGSPFYQRYMQVQNKYPEHIVLFSRGDFYEALGKGAELFAEDLALTLTSRDCGLLERVPMIGIPHHTVDNYICKALECGLKIVLADSTDNVKVYPQQTAVVKAEEAPVRDDPPAEDGKHWINDTTYVDDDGEVHTVEEKPDGEEDEPTFDMSAYDAEVLAKLDEIFGNVLELR